ncbi:hypothetical protein K0U83_13860 [bacterium]|nr:hypothetical protein [bacterium]
MSYGLRPVRYKSGAPYNGAANTYFVPSSDSTALFVGDPVLIAGSADADGVATVARAAAGARITGVVVGFSAYPGDTTDGALETGFRAASTNAYVLVADDPDLLFEAREDAVGGALAVADVGLNVDLVAAAGSTATRKSGYLLDSSTKATGTAQVRIVGFSQRIGNVIGTNPDVLVSIVETTQSPADGSTGI